MNTSLRVMQILDGLYKWRSKSGKTSEDHLFCNIFLCPKLKFVADHYFMRKDSWVLLDPRASSCCEESHCPRHTLVIYLSPQHSKSQVLHLLPAFYLHPLRDLSCPVNKIPNQRRTVDGAVLSWVHYHNTHSFSRHLLLKSVQGNF